MRTNRLFLALGVGLSLLLVACGVSGPGSTWTPRTSNTTQHLYGVTYGNGTFVAVGGLRPIQQRIPLFDPHLPERAELDAAGLGDVLLALVERGGGQSVPPGP